MARIVPWALYGAVAVTVAVWLLQPTAHGHAANDFHVTPPDVGLHVEAASGVLVGRRVVHGFHRGLETVLS